MKRKSRKRNSLTPIILVLLILIFAATSGALILMLSMRGKTPKGTYVGKIKLTDVVTANTTLWLRDVEGVEISSDMILNKMQNISVDLVLEITPDGSRGGTYKVEPEMVSCKNAKAEVNQKAANMIREMAVERLEKAGYFEPRKTTLISSKTMEEVDSLIFEAFGMSIEDFIDKISPGLIPDYEKLVEMYAGSGAYAIEKGHFVTKPLEDEEGVIVKSGILSPGSEGMLANNSIIFHDIPVVFEK